MTLTNPKPLGYAFGEILPSADVNSVWSQLTKALDAIGGGTYNMLAPIRLEDQTFFAEFLESRDLTVNEGATIGASGSGSLNVADDISCGGDLNVGDDLNVTDDIAAGGDVNAQGTFSGGLNNVTVNNADETLFDGFQSTPVRVYTGASVKQTTIDASVSVYKWWLFVNYQSANRVIFENLTSNTICTLSANQWAIVSRVSGGTDWKVLARGALV